MSAAKVRTATNGEIPGEQRLIFFSQALREAIDEEMSHDATVFVYGEEVGVWGGGYNVTQGLLDRYGPLRVIDTPISEALIGGAAVGADSVALEWRLRAICWAGGGSLLIHKQMSRDIHRQVTSECLVVSGFRLPEIDVGE